MAKGEIQASGDAAGLAALIARAADDKGGRERGLPPVDKWNPPDCGDIDMEIRADGTWFYMGSPIGREALVRLFASVLRRDPDGKTYLVTPVEKCGIRVEDAPFLAVEMHAEGDGAARRLTLRTNVGDVVAVDDAHPLRFEIEAATGGLKPYVLVRGRLEALIARAVYYDLAERTVDHGGRMGVWSAGTFFPLDAPAG